MFNTFSKSDLKISKRFLTPFPAHAPKKVQDKYLAEYNKYLDSLSPLDSARSDYKYIKVSLWACFIVAVLAIIGLFGPEEFAFAWAASLFLDFICLPAILYQFFDIRKNLKEQLSKNMKE